MFQSDNGHSTEERAHFGGGSAGPYRGAKFSLLEGGIRLPAIISWPLTLPQNETRDQLAHACDWLPTLAELTEVKVPQQQLDGRSLVAVIRDAKAPSPHENHALHWQTGSGPSADWAVREGNWKLIGNTRDTTDGRQPLKVTNVLVNLKADPEEMVVFRSAKERCFQRNAQCRFTSAGARLHRRRWQRNRRLLHCDLETGLIRS